MFKCFKKNKSKNNSGTIIVKTNEQKIMEQKEQERKMICPNCGNNPNGGKYNHGLVLGFTDGELTYITCTHCNCDYGYVE